MWLSGTTFVNVSPDDLSPCDKTSRCPVSLNCRDEPRVTVLGESNVVLTHRTGFACGLTYPYFERSTYAQFQKC